MILIYREIVKIRVNKSANATTENIYRVKLTNNEEQPISVVKARMGAGVSYYYRNKENNIVNLTMTYPIYKQPFLCSVKFEGEHDPLLDLPHF